MKPHRTGLLLVLIPLLLLLLAGVIGDGLLIVSPLLSPDRRTEFLNVVHGIQPFDAEPCYRRGFILLERGERDNNQSMIRESITAFRDVLACDPFHALAHHHLGNALLLFGYPDRVDFVTALQELKKAVMIDRSDPQIVKDTTRVFMSMWPLLGEEDRQLCSELFIESVPHMNEDEFVTMIQVWWRYSRERTFILPIVRQKPEKLKLVSRTLLKLGAPLKLRWSLMAEYEAFLMRQVEGYYRSYQYDHRSSASPKELLDTLHSIRHYHRLSEDKEFDREEYLRLRNRLIIDRILQLLSTSSAASEANRKEAEVVSLVYEYIDATRDYKKLNALHTVLQRNEFFSATDLEKQYIALLFLYRTGELNKLIARVSALRESVSYIKPESRELFSRILLLQARAYSAQNLLSLAEKVLRDMVSRSGDNLDALALLYEINRVLDTVTEEERGILNGFEKLRHTRYLEVTHLRQHHTVYLLDEESLEIVLSDTLVQRLQDLDLLQIFIENEIVHESYISQTPESLILRIPEGLRKDKITVALVLLKGKR